VLFELARIYPDAAIETLWDDAPERFEDGRVQETWLARTPLRNHKAMALPLMPMTWRNLGHSDAEWIICSSHLFAHHARFSGPARDAPKFVYTHTPARYIWTPELDLRGGNPAVRAASRAFQPLDYKRAQEAESLAANSKFVADRIARVWDRDSTIIYPPVRVQDFVDDSRAVLTGEEAALLSSLPDGYLLGASRFVPYKRLDIAIEAGAAANVPVVIAGEGPDEARLRAIANDHPGMVTFIAKPSFAMLTELYRNALALIFPAVEDFGIMPVEAMAAGTPVIASTHGGVSESVIHGTTGALLESFDATSLREAVDLVSALDAPDCVARAWEFDVSVFDTRVHDWVGA
jgi:glycosyltransferase involved in cell wall biosynthesis